MTTLYTIPYSFLEKEDVCIFFINELHQSCEVYGKELEHFKISFLKTPQFETGIITKEKVSSLVTSKDIRNKQTNI